MNWWDDPATLEGLTYLLLLLYSRGVVWLLYRTIHHMRQPWDGRHE